LQRSQRTGNRELRTDFHPPPFTLTVPNLRSYIVRMLTESQVINSVCRLLETKGFHVIRQLSESEQGIDIEAVAPDGKTKVSIEAKGETSSKPTTARFGKPFDSKQVFDHVAKAFYCAARDGSLGMMAGIALPKNVAHVKCVQKILPALRRLSIEVFWVSAESIEIEGI
jgi:hypothetical protein